MKLSLKSSALRSIRRSVSMITALIMAVVGWVAVPPAAQAVYPSDALVLEYQTPYNNYQVSIPLYGGGGTSLNATIVWGDGTTNTTRTTDGWATHTYTTAGTYAIEITGTVVRFGAGTGNPGAPDSNYYLKKVIQWGTLTGLTSLSGAFAEARQLTEVPSTLPAGVTDLSYLFDYTWNINLDVTGWNTSNVTNMSYMFRDNWAFNRNIGSWNTGNVTTMAGMFHGNASAMAFNQNISGWDVSKVTNFSYMFANATSFNQELKDWNTSAATNMSYMFASAIAFNKPLPQVAGKWDVSNVTDMSRMFYYARAFNGDVSGWDVSKVTTMYQMFYVAQAFNQPIGTWNVGNVTNMSGMFRSAEAFNRDLSSWDVSKVTTFSEMFRYANVFNGDISTWNTGAATNLSFMFDSAYVFNRDIGSWNTSNVTTLQNTFAGAFAFNQNIGNWDISKVTTLTATFQAARAFNQDIGLWNTGAVIYMNNTFDGAWVFDQDITGWDTSKVTTMNATFNDARAFNQAVGEWNTGAVTTMASMFANTRTFDQPLTTTLNKWNTSNVLNMSYMFSGAQAFNQSVEDWDTSKVTTMEAMFQNTTLFDQPMSQSPSTGWNTSNVTNMARMFDGAAKFNQPEISTWDTSKVTVMYGMFANTVLFDQPLPQVAGKWATTNVTNMWQMFYSAKVFDQDLSSWNTGKVETMSEMFAYSEMFNQSLTAWDTSKVWNMSYMFWRSKAFNSSLATTASGWTTAAVTTMQGMFDHSEAFNQPLNSWDVSKVTNMDLMFAGSKVFNRPLDQWNTGAVTGMNQMFNGALAFNNLVGTWDVSKVTSMYAMFSYSPFNQDISEWNTGNVTNMGQMFMGNTVFNLPIDDWDTSKVVYFFEMFRGATAFNQPIYKWNISSAVLLLYMFDGATAFDMDLSSWNTTNVSSMDRMFTGSGLKPAHYSEYLKAQASDVNVRRNNVPLLASAKYLCGAEDARLKLTNGPSDSPSGKSWYIVDGGKAECLTTQTLTFDRIDTVNNTDHFPENREVTLSATATSELPVTFKWISGPCTVAGDKLTAAEGSAGKKCVIAAQQHGDETYSDAVQVLHWITIDAAAPVIATTSTIARAAVGPTVVVTSENFKSTGMSTSDFTIGADTTGLTLASVTRDSATQVTLTFSGTALAGDLTIKAKPSAYDPTASADSNTLTITVPGSPQIATTSTIGRTASNPTVVITGLDFKSSGMSTSDFTIGAGTTGLTLSSATRNSATQVTLVFSGTAAVGSLTIQAKASAYATPLDPSNTLTIVVPPAPVIATTSTIARTATNPSIVVTGTGFKAGAADTDFTIGVGTTGLTVASVTRDSATQVTIAFTGTAAVGAVTVQAKASAYTSEAEASNTLTVSVLAAPVIATTSTVIIGSTSTSVIVTGTGFKSGLTASDFTIDAGTTGLTLSTATRNSATQVTLAFTGTVVAGALKITAKSSAYDSATEDSNMLTITATVRPAPSEPTGPIVTVSSPVSVPFGKTGVTTLTANIPVGWTITGGADAALFTIVNGELAFKTAPAAGTYTVEVTATDASGNTTKKVITVVVGAAPVVDVKVDPNGEVTLQITDPAGGTAASKVVGTDKSGVSASLVNGKLVITDPTFSGKIKVEVQVTGSDGSVTTKFIDMVILPKPASSLTVKPLSAPTVAKPNTLTLPVTTLTWTASPNAKSYRVLVNGVQVGTTTATTFRLTRLLAKGDKVEIVALAGDSTVGGVVNANAVGGAYVVGNSSFDNNAASLNAAAKKFLDKVAAYVKANGATALVIEGHTDNVGSRTKNIALSKARAEAVRDYLKVRVGSGVSFTVIASASSKPVASNKTDAGKAANRRVDIKITN